MNPHLLDVIVGSTSVSANASVGMSEGQVRESRTELDSHANMVVMGRNCLILSNSGRHAEVNAFAPEIEAMRSVPIVDAAVAYDCPFTMKTYILIARNALYVPTMEHNLVPPFVMREAGVEVNEVPKFQSKEPSVECHSIYFADDDLRIPLSLQGVFSYFSTRKPSSDELDGGCEIIEFTPSGPDWNPHSDVYAKNEETFLDYRGDMIAPQHRNRVLLEDEDVGIMSLDVEAAAFADSEPGITAMEDMRINSVCSGCHIMGVKATRAEWDAVPELQDEVTASLCAISSVLDPCTLATDLNNRLEYSKMGASVGSMDCGLDNNDNLFVSDPDGPEMEIFDESFSFNVGATASNWRGVSAKHLAKVWRIDLDSAKQTLNVTSQRVKRDSDITLSRRLSTNDRMLRYRRIKSYFFTDTLFAKTDGGKSLRGNTCMQLFVSDKGFVFVVPMKSKSEFPQALKMFAKEVGVPESLIVDPSGEQTSKKVRKFCQQIGTTLRLLEESTQWANRAELYIGLIKEAVRKDMSESNCPMVLWDYCAERRARINNLTAKDLFQLDGRNSHESIYGDEGDISNLCQFDWYEWVYFKDANQFPQQQKILGRCLGPAKDVGNEMTQWILKSNGKVVARTTVRGLKPEEQTMETEILKRQIFDDCIRRRLGDALTPPPKPLSDEEHKFTPYEDDDEAPRIMPESDPVDVNGTPISEQPYYDRLIHAEVMLPQGEELRNARVLGRSKDSDGFIVGEYDDNPLLNTIVYDVEFPDGAVKQYSANVIAENMLSQVDSEGHATLILDSIVDYASDGNAVSKDNKYVVTKTGRRRLRTTTAGWKLLVRWKDGTEQWIPLKDLKESHPVDVADFAVSRGIDEEPAFCWWVPFTLKKRDRIIAAINSRVKKATHKYGVEMPATVEEAEKLDEKNGNTMWRDAIQKEMYEVSVAFEILDRDQHVPVGWTQSSGHLVFDVKMDLTRKARWVKDGHKTPNPESSTYAGVVSRESVRIALTYAALNGIDVIAADIRNAYLQAPSTEKHYIICGAEFGLEHVGKKALIRRALYGGKKAGRDFWDHLRNCMEFLEFKSCKADPDVWMRPAVKSDGSQYWEYVLLYVDDTLCISERGEDILRQEIGRYFELKQESIGPPTIYLGGKLSKVTLENGADAWAFGSSQYVKAAVDNVEKYLGERGQQLPKKAESPLAINYRPELDVSEELGHVEAAYYQSLIGILRWMVELGRVDICLEVSMMSSMLALPRRGHLDQLLHIFAYLRKYHNTEMVFDPSEPLIDKTKFERQDWDSTVYGGKLKEELPGNMPEPRGQGFVMRAFVDSDHAGDSITRRSRTGFLVFLNCAPIYWTSKKQTSIETSSFGSEFIAMKQCTEYVRGLRYKLRMMGIPCSDPTFVYGDNQSVLANTTMPHSTLKKKSNSIAYHFVREGTARDEWRTTYVNTHWNPADLLTKPLPSGEKRVRFVKMLLYHIYGTS